MGRNLITFIIFVFLCKLYRVYSINYLNVSCVRDYGNYTEGSVYQQNLNLLLPNLSAQASTQNFYHSTAGEVSDRLYGLYICRGDVNSDICAECIQAATQAIVQGCPFFREAFVWYEECLLRYSNNSIISLTTTSLWLNVWNMRNVSNYDQLLAPHWRLL